MIDVICWKWKPRHGYRSKFGPETVNVLRHMVRRFLKIEHRFSCITDDPRGIEPGIRIIPLWPDHATVKIQMCMTARLVIAGYGHFHQKQRT